MARAIVLCNPVLSLDQLRNSGNYWSVRVLFFVFEIETFIPLMPLSANPVPVGASAERFLCLALTPCGSVL